jgi:hypothetical protein
VFTFSAHPAAINITGGVGDAWNFLRASWQKWLPAVLVLAALQFVVYLLFVPDLSSLFSYDSYTGRTVWNPDAADKMPPMVVGLLLVAVLGFVVGWVYVAVAIGGLRNRPVTVEQVVVRGLSTLWAGFLLALAALATMVPVAIVLLAAPPLGILLMLAAIVLFIYVEIRLIFFNLAIFDGFGPIAGLRESWRLSQGSVSRLLGWGLMAFLITMVFSIVSSFISLPLTAMHAQAAAQAISDVVTATGSCFTVFLMAVLYESQRSRLDPTLYPYLPMPSYPGPYAPGWAPGPYPPAGPYAPGPYAAGPYPPGPWAPPPYPQAPGWPANQGVPPAWPSAQTGAPGWPANPYPASAWPANPYPASAWPANPSAGPVWVSKEPDAPLPVDIPKPPEPPASS